MDYAIIVFLKIGTSVALLSMICLGLAVIFGMMRVINLAHGEFLMIGAFTAIETYHAGISIWIAILVTAPLVTGIVGVFLERILIRRLYGRLFDTMLATWGVSLILIGCATVVFGTATQGISSPLGSLHIGSYTTGAYEVALIPITLIVFGSGWGILRFTRAGLIARGTMQNPEMAGSLGISTDIVYAITFGVGAALSGMAGALVAPLTGVVPTMGAGYIARAFITVISGGGSALTGTVIASSVFGSISTAVTFLSNAALGDVALLVMALAVLRIFPQGITGRVMRGSI
jgi:branched-chain amino acid transport system permease protein